MLEARLCHSTWNPLEPHSQLPSPGLLSPWGGGHRVVLGSLTMASMWLRAPQAARGHQEKGDELPWLPGPPEVTALGTGPSWIYGWFQMNSSILSFFGTGSRKKADNKQSLSMASHNSWKNVCIPYHRKQEPTCPGLCLPSNLSQHHFPSCAQLQPPTLPAMPFP